MTISQNAKMYNLLYFMVLHLFLFINTAYSDTNALKPAGKAWTANVSSVSIFKDGTAFFLREGHIPSDGWYHTSLPPAAILGSLWFLAPPKAQIEQIIAWRGKKRNKHNCASLDDLVANNVGQRVHVYLKTGTPNELVGVLKSNTVPKPKLVKSKGPIYPAIRIQQTTQQPGFVLLQTDKGHIAIPKSEIRYLQFINLPNVTCHTQVDDSKMLFQTNGISSGGTLRYAYVQKGFQWTPVYRIAMNQKQAQLRMQAVLVNNSEDIENTQISLIVGVPNIINRDLLSPLALKTLDPNYRPTSWREYRQQATQQYMSQRFSNVHTRDIQRDTTPGDTGDQYKLPPSGEDLGSLYVHKLGKISLRKGERAVLPVMEMDLPMQRFYRWQPGEAQEPSAFHRKARQSTEQVKSDRVWEYIELHNRSQIPLTTGPAMVMRKGQLISQDLMRYTPVGGKVELPISVASNLLSNQIKTEVSRETQSRKINHYWYQKVTYLLKMQIVNFSPQTVSIRVQKDIDGDVVDRLTQAKIDKMGSGSSINPKTSVKFTVKLEPRKSWRTSFRYSTYIR